MKNLGILIGSRAIAHHFADFLRKPKDIDVVHNKYKKNYRTRELEYHYIPPLLSIYSPGEICSPEHILTLKLSHIFWKINVKKHLYDIQFLLDKSVQIDTNLFDQLYEHHVYLHGPNTYLKFSTADTFFNDNVVRRIPHDDLHHIINPEPLFKLVTKQPNVEPIQELFFSLLHETQLNIIREETMVLALERFLIPTSTPTDKMLRRIHIYRAYSNALIHLMTKLTPKWLTIFIATNYKYIYKPQYDFLEQYENYSRRIVK